MRKKPILSMVILCILAFQAHAQAVDLRTLDAHVRKGFSLDWTFSVPLPADSKWKWIPMFREPDALTLRSIRDTLGDAQRYCLIMPFRIGDELLASKSGVGLYLESIGSNWQVFLNGYLVRDESYFDRDGAIRIDRSVKGALIHLDTRWLKEGQNVLAFMLAGDPAGGPAGIGAKGTYRIDAYGRLQSLRSESVRLMLIGIYAFFGIYHAILFLLRPKSRSYLYYSLGTLCLSLFLFSRTYIVHDLILDTRMTKSIEAASLFMLLPLFMAFFDSIVGRRRSRVTLYYSLVCAAASLVQVFAWREALILAWKITLALPMGFILYSDIIVPFRKALRHYRELDPRAGFGKIMARAMAKTDATKLFVGSVVVGTAVALDATGLSAALSLPFLEIGFLLLVLGTAAVLAGQLISVYRGAERLKEDLERRVDTRTKALEGVLKEESQLSVKLSETGERLRATAEIAAKDLRIATQVQQGFFPKSAPRNSSWDAAYAFLPASGISGDFYDFYQRGERFEGLAVGDVSGHGISSGLITVLARSIFHRNFHERRQKSLGAVLEAINEELIPELSDVENYLTAVLLRLEDDGRVEYASAAHPEILFKGAGKPKAIALRPKDDVEYKGPPLGREGIEAPYTSIRFAMRPGDAILIYTDGLNESRNVDGEEFGVQGVLSSLSSAPAGDAAHMLDYIMQEWRFHVSGTRVADDLTAVLLKKN